MILLKIFLYRDDWRRWVNKETLVFVFLFVLFCLHKLLCCVVSCVPNLTLQIPTLEDCRVSSYFDFKNNFFLLVSLLVHLMVELVCCSLFEKMRGVGGCWIGLVWIILFLIYGIFSPNHFSIIMFLFLLIFILSFSTKVYMSWAPELIRVRADLKVQRAFTEIFIYHSPNNYSHYQWKLNQ